MEQHTLAAQADLILEIVDNEAEFQALAGEWDELANQTGSTAVFARHCFVFGSWAQLRQSRGVSLHVVIIRSAGRAVLAAPMILRRNWTGFAALEWLGGVIPIYRELICDPAHPRDRLFQLLENQIRSLPRVRKLAAENVPDNSVLAHFLQKIGASKTLEVPAFSFDLTRYADWEEFVAGRSKRSRNNYRRSLRLLAKSGPVVFETVTEPSGLALDIGWMIEKKRAWVLENYGPNGWVFDPATLPTFERTAQTCAETGQAWVVKLRCGARIVAATLNYRFGGVDFPILVAQDPAWNDYSPGWLLTMEVYRQAFEQGLRKVDLMRGANPQKKRMSNEIQMVRSYKLYLGVGKLI